MCPVSHVRCHMSLIMCHVSHVMHFKCTDSINLLTSACSGLFWVIKKLNKRQWNKLKFESERMFLNNLICFTLSTVMKKRIMIPVLKKDKGIKSYMLRKLFVYTLLFVLFGMNNFIWHSLRLNADVADTAWQKSLRRFCKYCGQNLNYGRIYSFISNTFTVFAKKWENALSRP